MLLVADILLEMLGLKVLSEFVLCLKLWEIERGGLG